MNPDPVNQPKDQPEGKSPTPNPAPAPWEHQPLQPSFRQRLAQADEYDSTEGPQVTADDQMSLSSKLVGGGRDKGAAAEKTENKLCPACGAITTFVQGKCSNCAYKLGDQIVAPPQAFYAGPVYEGTSPWPKIVVAVGILVILIGLGFWLGPNLIKAMSSKPAPEAPAAGAPAKEATHAGVLDPVTVDDAFKDQVKQALLDGNIEWSKASRDLYIYRFDIREITEPGTSQMILLNAYAGGKEAEKEAAIEGYRNFNDALAKFAAQFSQRAGVTFNARLMYTAGKDAPAGDDIYIKYGYYYGLEHWSTLGPIVKGIEAYKNENGEYPRVLHPNVVPEGINTTGGFAYQARGYGYLPLYATDAKGYIKMGEGTVAASLRPAECIGYYLFAYTGKPSDGLDCYSTANLRYYQEKITPFPYEPPSPLTNVPLEPDGKPDGVACVIKTGELQK